MKRVYPIVLTPAENGYVVYVPDLQINTEGANIAEAMDMARDAICMWAVCQEDLGHTVPEAKTLCVPCEKGEISALVDVDIDAYRRANENRTVRKNITIPSWLNDMAIKQDVNFSAVLTDALKQQLHVER